ncbi:hypothetical protein ACHAXT_010675 [Thalassiosira profunda]
MSGFVEIESPPTGEEEPPPERIECYVLTNIEPRCCGPLARDLNFILPLRCDDTSRAPSSSQPPRIANEYASADEFPRTDHLKRIRRRPATEDEIRARSKPDVAAQEQSTQSSNSSDATQGDKSNGNDRTKEATYQHPKKRPKPNQKRKQQDAAPWSLDMFVGSVAAVDHNTNAFGATSPQSLAFILAKYNLSPESNNFVRRSLPGRPAHTKEELDQWNQSVWPTLFFEEKTAQYKEEQKALTAEEVEMMKKGMQEAVDDALAGREQWKNWRDSHKSKDAGESDIVGIVVMDPANGSVVSRASKERRLQGMSNAQTPTEQSWVSFPDEANPLCTPTMLAIQGVSRKEREVALGSGMESKEFKSGQYLCTGYDVYLTKEPNAYEAMALVHSRVRRVVFGVQDPGMGGLGGAAAAGIHSLPGTNHHYRAFRLEMNKANACDGELTTLVESLQKLHGDATS